MKDCRINIIYTPPVKRRYRWDWRKAVGNLLTALGAVAVSTTIGLIFFAWWL